MVRSREMSGCGQKDAVVRKREGGKTRRYLDVVKEDLQEAGAREDVCDRSLWRIRCGNPWSRFYESSQAMPIYRSYFD